MDKTPYDLATEALGKIGEGISEYANNYYDHDTNVRGITPYGSYKDTREMLEAHLDRIKDQVLMELQVRVAEDKRHN